MVVAARVTPIEHLGSAHDEAEVDGTEGRRRASGWPPARPSWTWAGHAPGRGEPLPIICLEGRRICGTRCAAAYEVLGFDTATGGDEVFRDLVLARIIEPTSKADSLRVLAETGVDARRTARVNRRLPVFAKPAVRQALSAACAARAGLGPASLVLYDVSHAVLRNRCR